VNNISILKYDNILRLKCTKIDFGLGYAPNSTIGELTTLSHTLLLGFKGPTFEEREGKEGEERERGRKVDGKRTVGE